MLTLGVRPRRQQVTEQRNRLTPSDPSPGDLVVRQVGDHTGSVGQTVQGGVVERDQSSVLARVHVGLEVSVAQPDGGLEREHGVLQADAVAGEGTPAMGERHRQTGVVEEGVVGDATPAQPGRSCPAHSSEV